MTSRIGMLLLPAILVAGGCAGGQPKRPAWLDRPPEKSFYFDTGNLKPAVSADENWLAINCRELIKLEHLHDPGKSYELKTPDYVRALAFAGNRYLVSTQILQGMFTDVTVWDVLEKSKVNQFRVGSVVEAFAVSPDGNYLALGTNRNEALLLKVPALTVCGQVVGFGNDRRYFAGAFAPDGQTLYLGDEKGALRRFRIDQHGLFPAGHRDLNKFIHSISVSPDGNRLAVGTGEPVVLMLKSDNFDEVQRIACDFANLTATAFSPDGNEFIAGFEVYQRDGDQFRPVPPADKPANAVQIPQVGLDMHSTGVTRVCYFPGGKRIVSAVVSCTTGPSLTGDLTSTCSGRVSIFKRD